MAELSMDINQWKAEYPFLKNAWTKYEEFEKPVHEKEGLEKHYILNCASIIWTLGDDTKKYRSFCEKLIRNLEPYKNKKIIEPSDKSCKSLQSWLYYFKMKYSIPNNFIQECYKKSQPLHGLRVNNHICPYYQYEKVNNVEKDMPKINIFVDNISTIENILKDNTNNYNYLGKQFLKECFKIYNKINDDYCSNGENSDTINICLQLREFKSHYDPLKSAISEIPEDKITLNAEVTQIRDNSSLEEGKKESVSDEDQSTSSSVPSITTTALCTVAGVSSTLALLYKFTPAGRWINFGLRGGRRGINNDLHGNEGNEILFDAKVHSKFNSYNIGYKSA
ncbi:hypothetical protein, conserved [Plasmodium vivax]|uniref:VIR protein n=1 Tax=Plasmodium vivax TaxID=5855 RepID=A0A1G4EBY2_PLAVI|nr:hypothetical protein, conserved [Plasmodium vivax]